MDKSPLSIIGQYIRKIGTIPGVLLRNGLRRSLFIMYVYLFEPGVMSFLSTYVRFLRKAKTIKRNSGAAASIDRWSARKDELIGANGTAPRVPICELGLESGMLEKLKAAVKDSREVVIAEIDQNGFFLSHFGMIKGMPCISEDQFMQRKRFTLRLVAVDGVAGVKKHYKGCLPSFLNEIEALQTFGRSGCNVPAILDVDFENLTLTLSYVPGPVLKEELAGRGAVLHDRDVDENPDFMKLKHQELRLRRIEEGKRVLNDIVGQQFIEAIFDQMIKIHRTGFILNDIKYGNIIIEEKSGEPYLLDFELSMNCTGMGNSSFRALRDLDIEKFNLHFGVEKTTYKRIKNRLKTGSIPMPDNWYAPVYIGAGLKIGRIWDPDSGWGRWHYILKDNLPQLKGARVLDLGANNSYISLLILRNGARESIGFEINSSRIEQGEFLKSSLEWMDNKKYKFKYIQESMADLPSMDLGEFDIAIALCSIYYLDDESIAKVTRHISTISEYFVIQCNTSRDIGRENMHVYEKASVDYLKDVLIQNGFPNVQMIAPRGYPRPLLIGSKNN